MSVLTTACASPRAAPERLEFTEVHMAMPVRIVTYARDANATRDAARAAFARIAMLEATMSDYRPQSELRRLQERAGAWVEVSPALFSVLRRAAEVAEATDGAYDPTVAPLTALWRAARRTGTLPPDSAIAAASARVGWRRIALDAATRRVRLAPGTQLDLGGIAKGFILQQALDVLRARGIDAAMVEAGGDIVVGDAPPGRDGWRVEVAGIDAAALASRAGRLVNAALATSGPAAQFVEIGGVRYSHVVDPRTGQALTDARTAHVIATDAMTADALATALTVLNVRERDAVVRRLAGVVVHVED